MFSGIVTYQAKIRGNGLEFAEFDYNPNVAGVDHVNIGCPAGHEITCKVHLAGVANQDNCFKIAEAVTIDALNRLSFEEGVSILNTQKTADHLVDDAAHAGGALAPINTHVYFSSNAFATVSKQPNQLRPLLEQAPVPGYRHIGLFRSALRSTSPVEAFMHLYNLMLMLFSDSQSQVDAYIMAIEPATPQTDHPLKTNKRTGLPVKETIYTRLRNEFAHARPNVDSNTTKASMVPYLSGLKELVRRAMRAHP